MTSGWNATARQIKSGPWPDPVESRARSAQSSKIGRQPTEWQRIGKQFEAAMIFARSDFVNVHHFSLRGNRFTITAPATTVNTRTTPTINAMINGSASGGFDV